MAPFVLVHGSWHGGWCWKHLTPHLVEAGHRVSAPTLTGMAERAHAAPAEIRLATHAEDVRRLLDFEDLRDVVLVGHSYGGMVITAAAARDASRIGTLVYLDAYLPEPGESEMDLWPPDMAADVRADLDAGRDHRTQPPPEFFGLHGELAEWADQRMTAQPLSVYEDPASDEPLPDLPGRYIHCTEGTLVEMTARFADRAQKRGWPVDEIPTGHDVMLTMPEELASVLERAV